MTFCRHCKAETDASHYRRIVENHTPLYGPWEGWRMAGRDLIAPDRQRISPERLRGLLFQEANRNYLARRTAKHANAAAFYKFPSIDRTLSLPARERFAGYA